MSRVIWAAILLFLTFGCAAERGVTTVSDSATSPPVPPTSSGEPTVLGDLVDETLLDVSSDDECLVDADFDYEEGYDGGHESVDAAVTAQLEEARTRVEDFEAIRAEILTVEQANALLAAEGVVAVLDGARVLDEVGEEGEEGEADVSSRTVVGPRDTDARPARAVFEDLGRGWVMTRLAVFGENDGCDGLLGDG